MLMWGIYRRGEESEAVHEPIGLRRTRISAELQAHRLACPDKPLRDFVIKPVDVSCAPVREVQS